MMILLWGLGHSITKVTRSGSHGVMVVHFSLVVIFEETRYSGIPEVSGAVDAVLSVHEFGGAIAVVVGASQVGLGAVGRCLAKVARPHGVLGLGWLRHVVRLITHLLALVLIQVCLEAVLHFTVVIFYPISKEHNLINICLLLLYFTNSMYIVTVVWLRDRFTSQHKFLCFHWLNNKLITCLLSSGMMVCSTLAVYVSWMFSRRDGLTLWPLRW